MSVRLKLSLVLLSLMSILCLSNECSVKASTSGTCGKNLTWLLDDEGTLTVSGKGNMYDYKNVNSIDDIQRTNSPFYDIRYDIRNIIIEDGVTSIGEEAFLGCFTDTIEIAGSVKVIGEAAFIYNSVINVVLHEGITTIETYAFNQCGRLKYINLPESITSMGYSVFLGCTSLEELILPESLTRFSISIVEGCTELKKLTIPSKCTQVDDFILACQNDRVLYYDLDEILVAPGNTTYKSVDGVLFSKDGTELVCYPPGKQDSYYEIPSNVTSLHDGAFADTSYLTQVKIPDGIVRIPEYAFMHSGLTSITLSKNINYIGDAAFDQCKRLREVHIYSDNVEIGSVVFGFNYSLEKVYFYGRVYYIHMHAFSDVTATIYYPKGNRAWNQYKGKDYDGTLTWISSFELAKPVISSVKRNTKGVEITWDKLSSADKYTLYRRTNSGEWIKLTTTTKTSVIDRTANTKGAKYSYKIVAVKGTTKSQKSDTKSIKLTVK